MTYVIKRYSNRKLYDLQQSRYVTLEELEHLIRDGKTLSVVDAATGGDLTSITLVLVLLERERGRRSAVSPALLHQLIRAGEAWQESLRASLRSGLDGIVSSQQADRIVKTWEAQVGLAPPKELEGSAGGSQGSPLEGERPENFEPP